jgi:hypothetical protein
MSLGIRLMISIARALLGCLAFDSVFVYWQAVSNVDTEIRAGLAVGATLSEMRSPMSGRRGRANRWNPW